MVCQADLEGVETYIEIPLELRNNVAMQFRRPVARLKKALYGHPLAEEHWEAHCDRLVKLCGFTCIEGWPSLYLHLSLQVLLGIYVDEFKMFGPKENMDQAWALLKQHITMDGPGPASRPNVN